MADLLAEQRERLALLQAENERLGMERDWYRDAHEKGKEILDDLRIPSKDIVLPDDTRAWIEDWHNETFFEPGTHPSDEPSVQTERDLLRAQVEELRRVLRDVKAYVGDTPHTDLGEACGVDACAGCLIHGTVAAALDGGSRAF